MVFFLFSNVSKRFTKGSKRLITYSFANLLKTLQTQQKKNIARFAVNFFYPTVLVLITLLSRLEFGIFFIWFFCCSTGFRVDPKSWGLGKKIR